MSRSALSVAMLAALFAVVSLMVILTRGRNPLWIRRKLRLGALLLSLTTVAAGAQACEPPTCYVSKPNPWLQLGLDARPDELASNQIEITNAIWQNGERHVTVSRAGSLQIPGRILQRSAEDFSVFVLDPSGTTVQSGNLSATDGAFDSSEEAFVFAVSGAVTEGTYRLRFYAKAAAQVVVAQEPPIADFVLHVEP